MASPPRKTDFDLKFYDPGYVTDVMRLAEEFLLARDRYIAAWLDWQGCCLGVGFTPEQEAQIMQGILEDALKARETPESA